MTTLATPVDTEVSDITPMNSDIPVTAEGFLSLNLSNNLLKALSDMGFVNPSAIQKEAIPQVMAGTDIIAKAPTGSGKTAAFAIPIIEKIDLNPENKSIQALILSPTRELTIQVHKEFEKMTKYIEDISVVSIYGGQNIDTQFNALKRNPQIVVATPGRLMDHLDRGTIKLDLIHTIVLDEADEMLDMGFREDIHTILGETSENHQTILFSATMAKDIMELTNKFMNFPNVVDVSNDLMNTPNIEQQYFEVVEKTKIELLTRLVCLHNIKTGLVFCNTKANVDKVVENLKTKGYFADAIHGDMSQSLREKVMRGFRNGTVKILVATDVAGRGIDVKDIEAVFNYDLPRDDEDYIHRIGRTGRAGTSGIAFTFVSKRQVQHIKRIERANGIQIHETQVPTFDEIEAVRVTNFENKLKTIIERDDISEFQSRINAMVNENLSLLDIAAALLKLANSKEGRKINKDVDFEIQEEEKSSGRNRRRGSRDGRGSRDSRSSRDGRASRKGRGSRSGVEIGSSSKDEKSFSKKKSSDKYSQKEKIQFSLGEIMKEVQSVDVVKKERSDKHSDKKFSFGKSRSEKPRRDKMSSSSPFGEKRGGKFSGKKSGFGAKKSSRQKAK